MHNQKYLRQFTVFTASTEHDSKTITTITYTSNIEQHASISLDLEALKNLDGLVMEESVYGGGDNKFQQ